MRKTMTILPLIGVVARQGRAFVPTVHLGRTPPIQNRFLMTRTGKKGFQKTMSTFLSTNGQTSKRHWYSSHSTALSSMAGGAITAPTLTASTILDTRPFQITTPIYYVNDKPHIGHAYTTTACDVIARFMRLSGREVFFLTGTDEHGQKVEQSAQKRGIPPQQFVDELSKNFEDLLSILNISHDHFIRTTEESHKQSVQHFWNVLTEKGYIYKGTYSGWYSVRDECFYNDSELINGLAPTGATVEWVAKEESYFFRLSAMEEDLLTWYEQHPDWIAPISRRNEVLAFVKGGLKDLSISRTSFQWGVPVPNDPDHIMYVWIDALTNYISALGYPPPSVQNKDDDDDDDDNNDKEKSGNAGTTPPSKYETFWPAALHVVGKDILRFHAIYWPAFLMAADLPLPKRVFAHGWWTKDGEKISKSLGNVIDPVKLVEQYGVDQTRFFLMSEVGFGNDGDFSDKAMILKVNNNLANELGNLCQRVMSMVYKNCNKAIPDVGGGGEENFTERDKELLEAAEGLYDRAAEAIAEQAIQKYANVLIEMVWEANKYIDDMAPWTLRKTDPERMVVVLYVLMEVLRYVSILYQPIIPMSANMILDQLTVPKDERSFAHLSKEYQIKAGSPVSKPEGVFPRIEDKQV